MNIIKVSSKGQITIPKKARDICDSEQYMFEMEGKTIILTPIVIQKVGGDLDEFSGLAKKAFEFWNNQEDDIYQEFYEAG